MLLHFSPTLGAWTRCKARSRPGAGVSLCPNFTEDDGHHVAGMTALATIGGGQIHRNGRLTTVTPNTDGTFTARTGKLTRVYDANGNLLPLRARLKDGWSASERLDIENQALKALVEAGAYHPQEVSRLSGVARLDKLRRLNPYEWANMPAEEKESLVTGAFNATAKRFGVDPYQFAGYESMKTLGHTTFYADNDREPVVTLSSQLLTTLSNRTATDAIARQVAHLIEGRAAGHGPAWQARVRELRKDLGLDIEGNPMNESHHKTLFEKEQTALYARNSSHMATCSNGHTFYRRALEDARGYCGDCYRETQNPNVALRWKKNPDAGKWVLTPNGLERKKRITAKSEPKATRGRKITSWKRLPAIESKDDFAVAVAKMSDDLKSKIQNTDRIFQALAGKRTVAQRRKVFREMSSWEREQALKSGHEIPDDLLTQWRASATEEPDSKTLNEATNKFWGITDERGNPTGSGTDWINQGDVKNLRAMGATEAHIHALTLATTHARDERAKFLKTLDAYAPDPQLVAYVSRLRQVMGLDGKPTEGGTK